MEIGLTPSYARRQGLSGGIGGVSGVDKDR